MGVLIEKYDLPFRASAIGIFKGTCIAIDRDAQSAHGAVSFPLIALLWHKVFTICLPWAKETFYTIRINNA